MTKARRILVLTLSFGSGHVRAARAVAAELKRCAPDADIHLTDALEGARFAFRALYVWPYWAMLRYAPALWKRFFESRVARHDEGTAPAWAFRYGCPDVFEEIARFEPDTIVAVEVAACEMAVIARRAGLTDARVVNVITDHEAEPVWVKPEVSLYAVADERVREQLCGWGAAREKVAVVGIPTDAAFSEARGNETFAGARGKETFADGRSKSGTRAMFGVEGDAPLVLLMGGGQGPTRMDEVAARLCRSRVPMCVVAVAGRDARARRRLGRIQPAGVVSLRVLGWTEEVADLMRAASLLVTKPGGLTLSEAAQCGLPVVMFDRIPGPETVNAERFASAGAGLVTRGADETAAAVERLLMDERARAEMSARSRELARPRAAADVARLDLDERLSLPRERVRSAGAFAEGEQRAASAGGGPVLILSISNGAAHTRAAEAIASAMRAESPETEVRVVDVADYMTRFARFMHVTAYLWLVRHAPLLWERVDRYQKRQTQTSPEWFYRRGCRALFELARELRPRALVATEVGCCEVAALIKRDVLSEQTPLVAVGLDYDADRAWVQRGVNLYSVTVEGARRELIAHGAPPEMVRAWGVPLSAEFGERARREDGRAESEDERAEVCRRFKLDARLPLVLVAGGGEGLGRIEETVGRLLRLRSPAPQLIVLTGRNERLRRRLKRVERGEAGQRLRVIGWTTEVARLMRTSDLLVSKCGNTFDEALACELPLVALEPPPGSERVQYALLEDWGTGRAVRTTDELAEAVADLLTHAGKLEAMREKARTHRRTEAAARIARWVLCRCGVGDAAECGAASLEVTARESVAQTALEEELVGDRA